MTMPFDPYYMPSLAPQRAILARPEYDAPGVPLAMPDAPLAMQGPTQGFSLAGPPMSSEPPPLVSQAPPPPIMSPAPPPAAPPPAPLMAAGDSLSQGAGGSGGGLAPAGAPPSGPLVANPNMGGAGQPAPAAAAPPFDLQNPGRTLTPAEQETLNLLRLMRDQELRKRASAGRWVPQQKLQTSEATQGQVGPDPELFGRYVDARSYRTGLDKENADMEAGIAQRQADAAATARGIEETARLAQERIEKQGQERAAAVRDQIGVMNEKVQGEQYDNMRLWNSASDGKKAGFLMAAVLSGIGQAMMGQGGQQNSAIKALMDLSDRDAERQKVNIANNRQKLNDLQKLYKDTLEQTGSEKAAVSAVKIAKLEGLKSQVDTEAALKRSNQTTTKRMLDKDGNVVEWSVPLAAERTKAAIDERIAQEDMIMSREINGQVSKQYAVKQAGYQGGSSGPDMKKVLGYTRDMAKMEREGLEGGAKLTESYAKANEAGGKAEEKEGARTFRMGGVDYMARPGTPEPEMTKIREQGAAISTVQTEVEQLRKLLTAKDKLTNNQLEASIRNISGALNSAQGQGAMTADDINWFKSTMASLTTNGIGAAEQMSNFLARRQQGYAAQVGARPKGR